MTQTALSWLENELSKYDIHKPISLSNWDTLKQLLEQAKAMEKHQTLVFGMKCQGDYNKYDFHRNIVDIYNETYNK